MKILKLVVATLVKNSKINLKQAKSFLTMKRVCGFMTFVGHIVSLGGQFKTPALGVKHNKTRLIKTRLCGFLMQYSASIINKLHAAFGLVTLWSTTSHYRQQRQTQRWTKRKRQTESEVKKCSTGNKIYPIYILCTRQAPVLYPLNEKHSVPIFTSDLSLVCHASNNYSISQTVINKHTTPLFFYFLCFSLAHFNPTLLLSSSSLLFFSGNALSIH